MDAVTRTSEKLSDRGGGVYSVRVASQILLEIANSRHAISLKVLSVSCKMSPSKVHRYLHSLAQEGLILQGHKSGKYQLGRNAVLIGLAAMQQIDQFSEVMEGLPELVGDIKCHVTLSVWSKAGPVVVQRELSDNNIVEALSLGQTLPILRSAAGRVFAAFLPEALTRELIEEEQAARDADDNITSDNIANELKQVREARFAVSRGEVESETMAISVPVLDWQNNPVVSVSALMLKNSNNLTMETVLKKLMKFADQRSVERPSFPY